MDKLKLQTNVPEIIALKFTKGIEVESQFGDGEMLYTLTDGRKWYAPVIVASKVDALQLGKGEEFQVLKRAKGNNKYEYEVQRAETALATQLSTARRVEAPRSGTASQGTTEQTQVSAPQPADQGAREYTPEVKRFLLCFRDALDVANEVEKYGHRRSFTLTFETDDIRALATTLFIQGGGR